MRSTLQRSRFAGRFVFLDFGVGNVFDQLDRVVFVDFIPDTTPFDTFEEMNPHHDLAHDVTILFDQSMFVNR